MNTAIRHIEIIRDALSNCYYTDGGIIKPDVRRTISYHLGSLGAYVCERYHRDSSFHNITSFISELQSIILWDKTISEENYTELASNLSALVHNISILEKTEDEGQAQLREAIEALQTHLNDMYNQGIISPIKCSDLEYCLDVLIDNAIKEDE